MANDISRTTIIYFWLIKDTSAFGATLCICGRIKQHEVDKINQFNSITKIYLRQQILFLGENYLVFHVNNSTPVIHNKTDQIILKLVTSLVIFLF